MSTKRALLAFAVLLGLAVGLNAATLHYAPQLIPRRLALFPSNPARWQQDIHHFEAADSDAGTRRADVVFVGSSTIRLWDLPKFFADLPAAMLNRGFGGSMLSDSVYYADRIVTRYQPRVVVVYAGDNDIEAGVSPRALATDFADFVGRVHARVPNAQIIFISIKTSPARQPLAGAIAEANARIRDYCATDPSLVYLDTTALTRAPDGMPRRELFQADGIHLSAQGYALFSSALRPVLRAKLNGL